jgi:DNA repair exonuclease SbcCD nuclease subunit
MRKHHKLQKSINKSPKQNEILVANKFRFKNGHLEINLMSEIDGNYSTWILPHLHPNICIPVDNHQIKITGNPEKLINSV